MIRIHKTSAHNLYTSLVRDKPLQFGSVLSNYYNSSISFLNRTINSSTALIAGKEIPQIMITYIFFKTLLFIYLINFFSSFQNAAEKLPKFIPSWTFMYVINAFVVVWVTIVGFGFGGWASMTNFIKQVDTFGLFAKCYQCPPKLPASNHTMHHWKVREKKLWSFLCLSHIFPLFLFYHHIDTLWLLLMMVFPCVARQSFYNFIWLLIIILDITINLIIANKCWVWWLAFSNIKWSMHVSNNPLSNT